MKKTKFRGFTLWYAHAQAMESMCREAERFSAFCTPRFPEALIVDCGANIGVSVLHWKSLWPHASILCFEPNPSSFDLLQRNIQANDLPGVQAYNLALTDFAGPAKLYGDVSTNGDARGNSLNPDWGRRPGTASCEVHCTQLSDHLNGRQVDFVKLDVEGSEGAVLRDLAECLPNIDALYVEVHETCLTSEQDSLEAITQQLQAAGFHVEMEPRADETSLPAELRPWQQQQGATQTQLLCWKPI